MAQTISIQFTRFSAFYSPLIATIAGGFLKEEGFDPTYSIAPAGRSAIAGLIDGSVQVAQSAPSQGFTPLEKGQQPPALHFAQVNEKDGFFITAQIALLALLLAVVVGMILGAVSALNHNGPFDYVGVAFATVGASIPNFIMAAFLSILFAVNLGWFKISGWGGPQEVGSIFHFAEYEWNKMVIPVVALATLPAAFIARVTRASMLEVLNQDYVRTARAKGLREDTVIIRHAVKNALIPVLTVIGPIAATLLSGSFIIETMFSIPGVGREFVDAVARRDYGMIMGSALFFAALVAIANLVVDLLYAVVDPRIRYG